MEKRFNVVFQGKIKPDYTVEQVKHNIANLYNAPVSKIESWFSGRCITVKRNITEDTAYKYKNALEKAGAVCMIEEVTSPVSGEGKSKRVNSPLSTNSNTHVQQIICPNCGFEQPNTEECRHCGIIIQKFLQQKKQDFLNKQQHQQKQDSPNAHMIIEQSVPQRGAVQVLEQASHQPLRVEEPTHDTEDTRRKKGMKLIYIFMTMLAIITVVSSIVGYIQYSEHRREQQQIEEEAKRLEQLELAKASYLSTGEEVVGFMIVGALSAVEMCGEISEAWSDSIKWGNDFNVAIRRKVQQLESSNVKLIKASREQVDEFMEKLDVAPQGFERHQEKMFELYGEFNKLCNQAVSPSGSLMTYNQSINNSQEKFLQLLNEVKVLFKIQGNEE